MQFCGVELKIEHLNMESENKVAQTQRKDFTEFFRCGVVHFLKVYLDLVYV